jgi:MoaA/NifB/PqqE/SkfB family radical SAM enzyme
MTQERKIINDPLFKNLSYHKNFQNVQHFPGEQFLCWHPYNYVEVRKFGAVNICCPQWNPAEIGNIFDDTLENIWASEKAKRIRDTIENGSFKYCNSETCPKIQSWRSGGLITNTPGNVENLRKDLSKSKTPTHVHLVVDHSCNLACPSCRGLKVTQLNSIEKEKGYISITRTLASLFPEPHNEYKLLGMDGSGEIFSSELYRTIFETHDVFTKTDLWPNLHFVLTTNGTMMTEKIQRKYKSLFDHVQKIEISIDAGNKESYERVRLGGDWDLLWKNIEYFYSNTKNKKIEWIWNLIVQQNNYESIPELFNLANKFQENKPNIKLSNLLNWGTWSEDDYLRNAVHIQNHPNYEKYKEIRSLSIVKNYQRENL